MLTLTPSGRSHTLRAGIICLIFGAGMFIAHLIRDSSQPKRFADSNPAPVVTPPSGQNQNWASIPANRRNAVKEAKHLSETKSTSPITPSSGVQLLDRNGDPISFTTLQIFSPSPVTVPGSLVQIQVESVVVSKGRSTEVHFKVTGSGVRNGQTCDMRSSARLDRTRNFISDDKGHQYKAILRGWGEWAGCPELKQGEIRHFSLDYQAVSLPVSNLVIQYNYLDSPSISIPVRVRQ